MIAKIEARQPRPKKTPWDGGVEAVGCQNWKNSRKGGQENKKTKKDRRKPEYKGGLTECKYD
jgi:hypothetical protein